jgi:hypothetical protein
MWQSGAFHFLEAVYPKSTDFDFGVRPARALPGLTLEYHPPRKSIMDKTWASGAIELLRHADSHIHLDTAFDKRIAFISIDNAVETSVRTFLSLPSSKSGINVPKKDIDAVENNFPGLLRLLWCNAALRLTGMDQADIEHYHRIRNKLYHDGTGLSVDPQYLLAYRQIAVLLLKSLFNIDLGEPKPVPSLERLILLWNQIEERLARVFEERGIDRKHTFAWEEAMRSKVFDAQFVEDLTVLRMTRNQQVHSSSLDQKQIEYAVAMAENLLGKLETIKSTGH